MMSVQVFVALLGCAGMSAAVIDLFIFRLRHDLGQSGQVVGLCLGGAAVGALVGALTSARLRKRLGAGACILGGTSIQAAGLVAAGFLPGVATTVLGAFLWAAGLSTRAVVNVSLRQELAPDALLGRVMAATTTMVFGAATLGAVIVTRTAGATGATPALALVGIALAVVVAVGWRTPLARAR
jgi:MFS family permease